MNAASIPRLLLTPLVQAAAEHLYHPNDAGDITVVATEPSADVQHEIIVETLKPAVHWRHGFPHVGPETVLVQASEVVTKSPLSSPPSPQA